MSVRAADMDPLVLPFLDAADEEHARTLLGELLIGHASPLIRQILHRQSLSSGSSRTPVQDVEDLHAALLLRLTAQFWALRRGELAAPIASVTGYVARAAFNGCHEWLRQRAPPRARLQSRVRYVVTHDPRLVLRESADRDWWCAAGAEGAGGAGGVGGARGAVAEPRDGASEEEIRAVAEERLAEVRRGAGDPVTSPRAFAAFIHATLEGLGRPCRLAALVAVVAACLGEQDAPAGGSGGGGGGARGGVARCS